MNPIKPLKFTVFVPIEITVKTEAEVKEAWEAIRDCGFRYGGMGLDVNCRTDKLKLKDARRAYEDALMRRAR